MTIRYRVRYLDKFDQIARQMIEDGEREVQIEDETGQLWGVEGLAGS